MLYLTNALTTEPKQEEAKTSPLGKENNVKKTTTKNTRMTRKLT